MLKKLIPLILILMPWSIYDVGAQDPEGLKEYTFVMLMAGQDRDQPAEQVAEIQKQHLAHLDKMANDGLLDIAGPFLDDGEWRGILIFNISDLDKVKQLVESDPAVSSGRLSYRIHPWMSQKGASLK